MKEKNDIVELFRTQLTNAEMDVRDDFWTGLEQELSKSGLKVRTMHVRWLRRFAAAASVALVLGAASAAFWYLSPREEMEEAFDKIAVLSPEAGLKNDMVQEKLPSIYEAVSTPQKHRTTAHAAAPVPAVAGEDEEEHVSVRVSITITQQVHGTRRTGNGYYAGAGMSNAGHAAAGNSGKGRSYTENDAADDDAIVTLAARQETAHKWSWKAGIGSSLPKGDYGMPVTVGLGAEYSLNPRLSLETGLQYNRFDGSQVLHTLSVPLKLNVMLASMPKVDLYAMAGGAVEKCVAGAPDNGFGAEPLQLSVLAGLGMRYKLSDRFALFAEPTVSHHFGTDSETRTLRTERPVNMNLLCGVRMTY